MTLASSVVIRFAKWECTDPLAASKKMENVCHAQTDHYLVIFAFETFGGEARHNCRIFIRDLISSA